VNQPTRFLSLSALVLAAAGTIGLAQIQKLTLDEMVAATDHAVFGEIVGKRVFRVDHPVDGPELYFTTLTIQGQDLYHGTPISIDVTYHGGFVDEEHGVYNSEAPADDDVKTGNRVVVFSKWADNMGGGVAANVLYAAHGGLYRTVEGPAGMKVLGRGTGYAVDKNIAFEHLATAIETLREEQGGGK
jgi:hypothetical protein